MKNLISAVFFVVGCVAATAPAMAAAPGPAEQTVDRLQTSLVSVMKAGTHLDYQARYKKLDPVVAKSFDFPFIAQLVLGADWTKLSADQQQKFVAALNRLSTSSYAKEFKSYNGERFDFEVSKDMPGGKLVRYLFKTGDGQTLHFDYQMRQTDGQWKIANVVVDGVSDLALKRGQYRKLLTDRGYEGLIAWINKQIDANAG